MAPPAAVSVEHFEICQGPKRFALRCKSVLSLAWTCVALGAELVSNDRRLSLSVLGDPATAG